MKNKGFTLVELLGVLVILGILMGVAIPAVYKYLTKSKTDAIDTLVKTSYEAAHSKASNDMSLSDGTVYYIKDLAAEGFMDRPIDPDNKSTECTGEVKIKLSQSNSGAALDDYTYTVHVKCSAKEVTRTFGTDGKVI